LVKSVGNSNWDELFASLTGPRFRTPTTLLPSKGKGMRLFSETRKASCGIIFDCNELNMAEAYMWPSGFFAKSEFNMRPDGSLKEGREAALVTVERLREMNNRLEYDHFGEILKAEIIPFNEVLIHVHGNRGLVGVFVRTTQLRHLLFAMGLRDVLSRRLNGLGQLPIVLHTPEGGVRPVPLTAQLAVLRMCMEVSSQRKDVVAAFGAYHPVDTRCFAFTDSARCPSLDHVEHLRFHAMYGITEDALGIILKALPPRRAVDEDRLLAGEQSPFDESACEESAFLLLGLYFAMVAGNPASALSMVRALVPRIFGGVLELEPPTGGESAELSGSARLVRCFSPPARTFGPKPTVTLRFLMSRVGSNDIRVYIGACLVLESMANGHAMQKVANAIKLLEEWLKRASSMKFRLQSCMDEKRSGEMGGFVFSDRIYKNRTLFHKTLLEVQKCSTRLEMLDHLHKLVVQLLNPCLRLQVLQSIMALDDKCDLPTVVRISQFALELVREMDEGETGPRERTLSHRMTTQTRGGRRATIHAPLLTETAFPDPFALTPSANACNASGGQDEHRPQTF